MPTAPPAPAPADDPAISPRPRLPRFLWPALFTLLAGVYLLQLASPLRLHTDATWFLRMAASAADGTGVSPPQMQSQFPHGYPYLLAALDRLGAGRPWAFTLVNVLALALGCAAAFDVLRRAMGFSLRVAAILVALAPLHFVFAKFTPVPMTDPPFFGLSMACCWALTRAESRPYAHRARWAWLALGAALAVASIAVRTIGIALLPALFWAALGGMDRALALLAWLWKRRLLFVIAAMVALALAVAVAWRIANARYFQSFGEHFGQRGLLGAVTDQLSRRVPEMGSVLLNLPPNRLPGILQPLIVYWSAGLTLWAFLLAGLLRQWRRPPAVAVYLAGYTAILILWPFDDPRFWLPVIPLLFATGWSAWRPLAARLRPLALLTPAYLAAFALAGVLALTFTTRLSFESPETFAQRYSAAYRGTYQAAFGLPLDPAPPAGVVLPVELRLLNRFDAAAAAATDTPVPGLPPAPVP